ncbi:Anaphase-promoting complex, cyclosome, subunit 3 [Posidoniimonas corsicana]|uniref:Anaphase-promoting complex, cyclosome, subunit 3 n=1 Tax=Posidoniimonas corsicana TaxID=1938618 RepID=A0A5C5VF97_9BACT|nr:hypothetical protein [Posidoniimonas corsicana]TWT37316.1 Anaphase-promoting complex, cyclosome, subunit 3 [Posidoniimonas corsicana]
MSEDQSRREPRWTASQTSSPPQAGDFDELIECLILRHQEQAWSQAVGAGEAALLEAPLPDQAWLALADAYSHLRDAEQAATAYEHLLSRPRLPAESYALIYAGAKRLGQAALAVAACRASIEHYPEDDAVYFAMATQMSKLGYQPECIVAVLERAVGLAPDEWGYRVSLALQHCRAKDWRRAYDALRRAPAEKLRSVECEFSASMLARCCEAHDDHPRARALRAAISRIRARAERG